MSRIDMGRIFAGILVVLALLTVGCTELADPLERPGGNCVGCHTDQAILETVAEPDTTGEEPEGEG